MTCGKSTEMGCKIKGKGLFIIVSYLEEGKVDVNNIMNTFNLKRDSPNLIVEDPLSTRQTSVRDGKFISFVNKIQEHRSNHKPSFLMFFLTAHGDENGEFEIPVHVDSNGFSNVKAIINIISKCRYFDGVPKIFVIDTCRGSNNVVESKDVPDHEVASKKKLLTHLLAPDYPDVLLLQACVEGDCSYANEKIGSFMIDRFCHSWRELRDRVALYDPFIKAMDDPDKGNEELYQRFKEKVPKEDVTGGWLTDICEQTMIETAQIKRKLKCNGVMQQPHLCNTLGRLSCIQILDTQPILETASSSSMA